MSTNWERRLPPRMWYPHPKKYARLPMDEVPVHRGLVLRRRRVPVAHGLFGWILQRFHPVFHRLRPSGIHWIERELLLRVIPGWHTLAVRPHTVGCIVLLRDRETLALVAHRLGPARIQRCIRTETHYEVHAELDRIPLTDYARRRIERACDLAIAPPDRFAQLARRYG